MSRMQKKRQPSSFLAGVKVTSVRPSTTALIDWRPRSLSAEIIAAREIGDRGLAILWWVFSQYEHWSE